MAQDRDFLSRGTFRKFTRIVLFTAGLYGLVLSCLFTLLHFGTENSVPVWTLGCTVEATEAAADEE